MADDVVWVDVLPSMDKLVPSLRRSLPSAGRQAGQMFGQSLSDAASEKVGAASSKMTVALKRVQDAAGQVAVAEAKLQALREKEVTDTGRLAAAEEAVARARRTEITANTALGTATRGVAEAQDQLTTATRLSTAAEGEASREAGRLARAQSAAAASTDRVGVAHRALSGVFSSIGAIASRAWLPVTATVAAAGAIGLKTAANMETANIGFTTMLGSGQKAAAFLRQLQQFAAATPFEFPELQTAASSLISIGIDSSKVIPIMTTLGNVTSGMGTGSEGIKRATVALQQMNAAGRIQAQDLNQLRDAGIPVYDLLSAAMGKTKAQVAELAQNGKLGKDALDKMMAALETGKGLERFNGLMDKQSQSLSGLVSTVKDTVQLDLAQMWQPLIPSLKSALNVATPMIGTWLSNVSGWFGTLTKQIPNLISAVKDSDAQGIGEVVDNVFGNTGKLVGPVRDAFSTLAPIVSSVWQGLRNLATIGGELGPVLRGALFGGLQLIIGALQVIGPAFAAVTGWLTKHRTVVIALASAVTVLVVAMKAHAAAMAVEAAGGLLQWIKATQISTAVTKAWAAVQWVLNAALEANPIVLVITGLVALGAALYVAWNHSQTFRDVVMGVWHAVAGGAEWLWGNVLKPVFSAVVTAWHSTVSAVSSFWTGVLEPVFSAIGTVATVMSHIVLFVVLAPIVLAWKAAVAVISFYWNNIWHPVLTAVAAVAQWLWTSVLKPVFGFISAAWQVLVIAVQWYWQNILMPVFHLVGTAASFMWSNVLRPVFSAISSGWRTLGDGLVWVYHHIIEPIWGFFGKALDVVKSGFSTAVDWIGKVWHSLESVLMAPVQFVIDVVWNNGLRGLWNTINNIWGGTDLGPFKISGGSGGGITNRSSTANARGMATGGVLPGYTPGRDVHRFWSPTGGLLDLSGGEGILIPQTTRALGGPAGIAALNDAGRRRQAFAGGGTVSLGDRAMSFLGSGWGQALGSLVLPGGSLTTQLAHYVSQERGLTGDKGSTPVWHMLGDLIRTGANSTWDVIKKSMTGFVGSSGGLQAMSSLYGHLPGGAVARWAPVVAQVLKLLHLPLAAVNGVLSIIGSESGGNPNAINLTDSNARAGHPSQGLMQTIPSTFAAYAGPYANLGITNPFANIYAGVNYADQRYGLGMLLAGGRHSAPGHYVGYDTGGLMPDGTIGVNTSGFDERVLSAPQDDYFRRRVEIDEKMDRHALPTVMTGFANYGTIHTDPETLARKGAQGTRRVLAAVLTR